MVRPRLRLTALPVQQSLGACANGSTRAPAHCRFQQAELVHSRTAMTAVAGILLPGVSAWLRPALLQQHVLPSRVMGGQGTHGRKYGACIGNRSPTRRAC